MTPETLRHVKMNITEYCDLVRQHFPPDARITIIVRVPSGSGDPGAKQEMYVFGDDDQIKQGFQKSGAQLA